MLLRLKLVELHAGIVSKGHFYVSFADADGSPTTSTSWWCRRATGTGSTRRSSTSSRARSANTMSSNAGLRSSRARTLASRPDQPEDVDALLDAGYRYALSRSEKRDMAEDLVQDTWLVLLQAREARSRGYLFRCTRTHYIDRYRRGQLVAIESLPSDEIEALATADTEDADA